MAKEKNILGDRLQLRASVSFLLKSAIHRKAKKENKFYGDIIENILLNHPDIKKYIEEVREFYNY